jgi:hypothetical protein
MNGTQATAGRSMRATVLAIAMAAACQGGPALTAVTSAPSVPGAPSVSGAPAPPSSGALSTASPPSSTSSQAPAVPSTSGQGPLTSQQPMPPVTAVPGETVGTVVGTVVKSCGSSGGCFSQEIVAGAPVRIRNGGGAVVTTLRTDEKGSFLVTVPPGSYRVDVEPSGAGPNVVVAAGITSTIRVEVP